MWNVGPIEAPNTAASTDIRVPPKAYHAPAVSFAFVSFEMVRESTGHEEAYYGFPRPSRTQGVPPNVSRGTQRLKGNGFVICAQVMGWHALSPRRAWFVVRHAIDGGRCQ